MTTPKEAYEERKKARHAAHDGSRSGATDLLMLDMVDRLVTAVERIAENAERGAV